MRQLRAFRRIPARIFLAFDTIPWYRIRHHGTMPATGRMRSYDQPDVPAVAILMKRRYSQIGSFEGLMNLAVKFPSVFLPSRNVTSNFPETDFRRSPRPRETCRT